MGYINPRHFTLDYATNKLTVDGGTPIDLKEPLRCAAAVAILTNRGAPNEVQLHDKASGDMLLSALDQLVNTKVRDALDAKKVASASLILFLGTGASIVTIVNGAQVAVRVSFAEGGLAGFLTLMTFLQRYIQYGITIDSPAFTGGLTDTQDLKLSTIVDGKTFSVAIEKRLMASASAS